MLLSVGTLRHSVFGFVTIFSRESDSTFTNVRPLVRSSVSKTPQHHPSLFVIHPSSFFIHPSFILHHSSSILIHPSFISQLLSFSACFFSYTIYYQFLNLEISSNAMNNFSFVFYRQKMNGKLMSLVPVNRNYSNMSPCMIKSRNFFDILY